jgi:hypothetical protein
MGGGSCCCSLAGFHQVGCLGSGSLFSFRQGSLAHFGRGSLSRRGIGVRTGQYYKKKKANGYNQHGKPARIVFHLHHSIGSV